MTEKKTVVFGGSFNPIHKAHTYIIKQLENLFDRVIIIPNYISPFKHKSVNYESRLKMISLALEEENIKKAEICNYEIEKREISYTIDTIKYLDIDNLYLVLGSENIDFLNKWKDIDKLKKLVTFYIINRKGFKCSSNWDFNFTIAPFTPPDISSALIKLALAFNKADNMLNKNVLRFIKENNLYSDYSFIVDTYKDFGLDDERIEHIYHATKYGINLAKIHDEDIDKTIVSLLLHDIAKNKDNKELINIPKKVRHGILGASIAKEYFKIQDENIINAIKYHTTGRANMSKLEKIVFLADSLEETRVYDGIDALRNQSKIDLDRAMNLVLTALLKKLKKENNDIYYLSEEALNYYKEK